MDRLFEVVNEVDELADFQVDEAVIKIVGVGSGGGNAVNSMIDHKVAGVQYIAVNTDLQALRQSRAEQRILLKGPTKGRGAGGDPIVGKEAAVADRQRIDALLEGADMVVLATGLGGGTGTGASPVIAEIARSKGILTIAVVTLPFAWEGRAKGQKAWDGLEGLRKVVDAYIVIPNDKLSRVAPENLPTVQAFRMIDQVLCDSVTGVVDLISRPGFINRDFRDVKAVLSGCGQCVMGTGVSSGEGRALSALEQAISNPLLEDTPIDGARSILVNVVQGPDGTNAENGLIGERVNELLAADGNLTFGLAFDESLGDRIKVTVIASGLEDIEVVRAGVDLQEQSSGIVRQVSTVSSKFDRYGARPSLAEAEEPVARPFRGTAANPSTVNESVFGTPVFNPLDGESELEQTPAYRRIAPWSRGFTAKAEQP
jgi:cell division protein FtsZ